MRTPVKLEIVSAAPDWTSETLTETGVGGFDWVKLYVATRIAGGDEP